MWRFRPRLICATGVPANKIVVLGFVDWSCFTMISCPFTSPNVRIRSSALHSISGRRIAIGDLRKSFEIQYCSGAFSCRLDALSAIMSAHAAATVRAAMLMATPKSILPGSKPTSSSNRRLWGHAPYHKAARQMIPSATLPIRRTLGVSRILRSGSSNYLARFLNHIF
jgi:hypothetical protein